MGVGLVPGPGPLPWAAVSGWHRTGLPETPGRCPAGSQNRPKPSRLGAPVRSPVVHKSLGRGWGSALRKD